MNQAPQNNDHLNETMLYKCPGPHEFQGVQCDYVIVPEADIEAAKAEGWHLTITDARKAREAAITAPPPALPVPAAQLDQMLAPVVIAPVAETAPPAPIEQSTQLTKQEETAPPTYDEMKAKATQLGLEFPGNISKAALLAMITAKLAEQV